MTTISINAADAKEELSEILNRVAHNKERVILTRRGKDIAAIVPIEDFVLIETTQDKNDLDEASASLKEARQQGTFNLEDLKVD